MNPLRIKVVFDGEIQERKSNARPSFVLLDHIQHPKISDFCDRIIYLFDLAHICPHGITLSINGDGILPSETSHILRETDIVSVGMAQGPFEHDQTEIKKES